MSDPYNTAPAGSDPWRGERVKKDRRVKNPRRRHSAKWDRCVKDVSKKGGAVSPEAVCTARVKNPRKRLRGTRAKKAGFGVVSYSIKGFGRNPRKLSKAAQRRQAKSLLDWAASVVKAPNMKFPGGRMSHDIARDQIALVRHKYASNPRKVRYLIEAHRAKDRLYYAGGSKFAPRNRAKLFDSRNDARALAVELKGAYDKPLRGWSLRVIGA